MPPIPKKKKVKKKKYNYLDNLKTDIKVQKVRGKYKMVKGEIIEGAGGFIALHKSLEDDKEDYEYQLTHTLTGCGLLNSNKVESLKELAREFWESLSEKSKKIWRTSDNPRMVAKCVTRKSKAILKKK